MTDQANRLVDELLRASPDALVVVDADGVIETATRVRIAFAASCPEAALFGGIARWFQPAAP